MNPELRPATRADVEAALQHLYGANGEIPTRILAYTGRVDGRVIAVGGIAIHRTGVREAFCDISDEGRRFPLSLHRGARIVLREAKRLGIRRVIVMDGPEVHAKTPNWLAHLGFRRVKLLKPEGAHAFIWEG